LVLVVQVHQTQEVILVAILYLAQLHRLAVEVAVEILLHILE
jgi:hypothetical protein